MEERHDFGARDDVEGAEDLVSGVLAFHLCPPIPSRTSDISDLREPLLPDVVENDSSHIQTTDSEGTVAKNDIISSPSSRELWGIPIQSICLLNLVAVIWGTQHAAIKSVVDDNDQNGATDESTAAYFTLARFGLAALLASPYTPGCCLSLDCLKKKVCWVESTTFDNGVDGMDGEEQSHSQHEQSIQSADGVTNVTSNSQSNAISIKLAWKYGAELGMWMFLGYAFQAIGLETTSASRSGFLLYLNVKFVPFFSFCIFGKRISLNTWISAIVAFSGTALIVFDKANANESGTHTGLEPFNIGDFWCIAAAAASAMFIVRMEAASNAVSSPSELTAATLWIVALASLLWTMGVSLWNDSTRAMQTLPATFGHAIQQAIQRSLSVIIAHPIPLIYLSGVTTTLANFIQSKAQKDISAERATIIYALDPVYGAIFAYILLGETLGVLGLIGASLIFMAAVTNALLDLGDRSAEEDVVSMVSDSLESSSLYID